MELQLPTIEPNLQVLGSLGRSLTGEVSGFASSAERPKPQGPAKGDPTQGRPPLRAETGGGNLGALC
jgi:hypothetical protein